MSHHARLTLGGDFELSNISQGNAENLTALTKGIPGTWTLSGRGALALTLKDLEDHGISHVHLPAYLCESIIAPLEALKVAYSFYPVDRSLVGHPDPPAGSATFVINYFGWLNPGLDNPPAETLIEDSCQAMLSGWQPSSSASKYIICSPRKFAATGLGGWTNLAQAPPITTPDAEIFLQRSLDARLLRGKYLANKTSAIDEETEKEYLTELADVENFLDSHPTESGIPELGLKVIAGIDWKRVAETRRNNWLQLYDLLSAHVELVFNNLPDAVAPLCFVIRTANRDRVRRKLAAQRIFCPVHWPLPTQVDRQKFPISAELSDTLLSLPIDQRYGTDEMNFLAQAVLRALEDN